MTGRSMATWTPSRTRPACEELLRTGPVPMPDAAAGIGRRGKRIIDYAPERRHDLMPEGGAPQQAG
ncbi:hypothetical protein ACFQZU_12570, partial [Streptomonospora algeriensis]